MKKINWRIRFKNPAFVMGLVSAVLLLIQQLANLIGFEFSEALSQEVQTIANTMLSILVALGVMIDPTTKGTKDSERALEYQELGGK